jgi:hypothetical protein
MTTTEANTLNLLPGAGPPIPRVPAHQLPVSSGELTKAGETAFPVRPAANRGQTVSERPSRDAAPRQRCPSEVHLDAPGERRVPAPGLRLRHPSPRWKPPRANRCPHRFASLIRRFRGLYLAAPENSLGAKTGRMVRGLLQQPTYCGGT